jgi:hypothetical protein
VSQPADGPANGAADGPVDGPAAPADPAADQSAAPAQPAAAPRVPLVLPDWVDPALRLLGAAIAVALGAVLALYGAFLLPLRGFGVRLPVSLLLALVGNPALVWFAATVTGRRLAGLLPAITWCVVYLAAATRTAEGDLLLTSANWIGLTTLLVGPLTFAVTIYGLVLRDLRSGPPASMRPDGVGPATAGSHPAASRTPAAGTSATGTDRDGSDPATRPSPRPVRPRRRRSGSAPTRRR